MKMYRLLASFAAAITIASAVPAIAEPVVRLASAQNSVGSLPIYIARDRGFFKDEGVSVEIVDFKGGAPAVQALAGGSVDFCICAGDHAVRLRKRGLPARILAGLTEQHGYGLLALADSPLTDAKSLRGHKVGITSPGSLTDNTIRYTLNKAGLNPDRDLTLLAVGTGAPMKAALDSKSIDAGMFTTPDVQSNLAEAGKYKVIQDYRNLEYPALDLIALESWAQKNQAAAKGFLRAVVKAEKLIQTDPDAVRQGLKSMFPNFDDKLVSLLVEDTPKHLSHAGEVSQKGYETMIDMLSASEPELAGVPYADVVSDAYQK